MKASSAAWSAATYGVDEGSFVSVLTCRLRTVVHEAAEVVGEPSLVDVVRPRTVDASPQQLRGRQLVVGNGGDVLGQRGLRGGERRAEAVRTKEHVLLRVEDTERPRVVV